MPTGRITLFKIAMILLAVSFFAAESAEGRGMGDASGSVPRVAYTKPYDQSTVDVSDGKAVTFEWAMLPIPSGQRDSYRFILRKDGGYNLIFKKTVDPRTFSVEVPADKFEDGMTYWWFVKQRDARTMEWSQYDIWYFKVAKK